MVAKSFMTNDAGKAGPATAPGALSLAVKGALLMMSFGMLHSLAQADIAQQSLIVKEQPVVEPNLMFTLDDSGSMSYNFVPDNELGGQVFAFHPREPDRYVYTVQGVLPTDDKTVVGARRRSPQINKIYYDPEVRYLPWIDPASVSVDADGKPVYKSLPDADPRAAYVHWNYQAGGREEATKDIRVDLTGDQPQARLPICAKPRPENQHDNLCDALPGATHVAPATYYTYVGPNPDNPSSQDKNNIANYRRVSIKDHQFFDRGEHRTDCKPNGEKKYRCSQEEEYKNFANWYQYHRTRMHVAIASVGRAFASLPAGVRLGYGRINKGVTQQNAHEIEPIDGVDTSVIERGVRLFKGEERRAFFEWLNNQIANGGTPLLEATRVVGEYYRRRDNNGPWSAVPGSNDPSPHISCRRSYHLLMTDGLYNITKDTLKGWNQIEADNVQGPRIFKPDGKTWWRYEPKPPYASDANRTLADFAMHYWYQDLRDDLRNDVPVDDENPAYWQHLTMYTLSFGVGGKLVPPDGKGNEGDWPALQSGVKKWPSPVTENEIETIDDLWHAAVNSRGEYLSVQDGMGFFNSVNRVLHKIVARNGSTSGVAVASQSLQAGNQKFVPSFMTSLWTGDLKAFEVMSDGSQGALQWSASTKMPTPTARNLFAGTRSGNAGSYSVRLNWDALPGNQRQEVAQAAGLDSSQGSRLITYLRGDKTEEEQGLFRKRNSILGHIVHSPPVYIGAGIDHGYQHLPAELPKGTDSGASRYRAHVRAKRAGGNRPAQVFVGSNDGILHAFNARTGVETYGFVPRVVLQEMARQAGQSGQARFLMDGPLVEGDAHWGGAWHNVLVGSAGAGPRTVFALDVTNTRNLGASTALWELDADTQEELGHVLAAPEIGVLRDGTWVAVFGNGYESRSRRAQLFVVRLRDGHVMARLDTRRGSADRPNGLGGVRLIRDGNQVITGAYAGDLHGNLWKFDLSAPDLRGWKVSFGGTPLYTTEQGRPITAAPAAITHPLGGMMVLVGTGKLFETGDNETRDVESVYGLWDNEQLGLDSNGALVWKPGSKPIAPAQVRTRTVRLDANRTYLTLPPDDRSNSPLRWRTERGWRIPLTMIQEQGQRNIVSPQLVTGLVLFETMSPVIDESETALACRANVNTPAFNLLVDPLSGRMSTDVLIDTNHDKVVNGSDQAVAGWAVANWTGRSVVLSEVPPQPCATQNCTQPSQPASCPPGMLSSSLQNVEGGQGVCVGVSPPARWWWRELSIPDKSYGAGQAVTDPEAGTGAPN
ncbi:MAG: PilC/PilY family type IV pilus protein [Lautropia sp.]|nr:PilC/PilY family type IV pilus protein [Lautropia sp.]